MNAAEIKRPTVSTTASTRVPEEVASVWIRLLGGSWSALAVAETSDNATADALLGSFDVMVASTTAERSRAMDLRGSRVDALPNVVAELRRARDEGCRLLLVVDDPRSSPLAQAALRMADANALLVRSGEVTRGELEAIAGHCAEGRLLGSILVTRSA